MKLVKLLLILLFLNMVQATDFYIYPVGYNENGDIVISITNIGNSTITDFVVHKDNSFEKKIVANLEPNSALQFYVENDGLTHKLKVCSENICKETEIIGVYKMTYDEKPVIKKEINYKFVAIILILVITLTIILISLKKPRFKIN
ncbi:MAG: hypothetical protein QXE34_00065 [Candidatus Aenigmatarchaeota archaeon]|nr:hypothetical protein [Candidatus Aenigmarchaeota archaeon]